MKLKLAEKIICGDSFYYIYQDDVCVYTCLTLKHAEEKYEQLKKKKELIISEITLKEEEI